MNEKRFKLSSETVLQYQIMDNDTDLNESEVVDLLNEQQATINELQSIINHIKCEENCFDYDYCCETVCSLYNEIKHLKEENEQLRKQCFELEKDYLIETSDISDKIYLGDEIKELKQRYGVDDE